MQKYLPLWIRKLCSVLPPMTGKYFSHIYWYMETCNDFRNFILEIIKITSSTWLLLTVWVKHFIRTQSLTVRHWKWIVYTSQESNWKKPRGVLQRNTALQWIRNNLKADVDRGVIYFADDDNSYSLEIFDEVCQTSIIYDWCNIFQFYIFCTRLLCI